MPFVLIARHLLQRSSYNIQHFIRMYICFMYLCRCWLVESNLQWIVFAPIVITILVSAQLPSVEDCLIQHGDNTVFLRPLMKPAQ